MRAFNRWHRRLAVGIDSAAGIRAVVFGFLGGGSFAVAKTIAAVVTGSAAMLAETVHSWVSLGAEIFLVPEVAQGLPFSDLTGLAGFPNGEQTRASGTNPKLYRQKLYLRQTWNFGGGQEKVEADREEFDKLAFGFGEEPVSSLDHLH